MSGDSRRRQILDAAKQCFAQYGFAGTTTRKVATAACISEGLLFRHFATKAALHAEILSEACEADPDLRRLLELEPCSETLAILMQEMVAHFLEIRSLQTREDEERLRLSFSSHLDDGEFARLLFEKVASLISPLFIASLESAIATGDAVRVQGRPIDLFWFVHHILYSLALTRLPETPSLDYPADDALANELNGFILRALGVKADFIAAHLKNAASFPISQHLIPESA
ncbi:TetR/AcrR family transcriptional regulator [[Pseudomonas] carboxydohydrogena]|uniref:TetR/AcrR family transcriptional regulator n=2 Tax=Afipia carboxydohydrogena TaxID=290 RepID=A0ABY8BL01_AFICR|nr:TetR/AcrR family transcriptional regulator [[Pseudomonas] carboxydohydrogena]